MFPRVPLILFDIYSVVLHLDNVGKCYGIGTVHMCIQMLLSSWTYQQNKKSQKMLIMCVPQQEYNKEYN